MSLFNQSRGISCRRDVDSEEFNGLHLFHLFAVYVQRSVGGSVPPGVQDEFLSLEEV